MRNNNNNREGGSVAKDTIRIAHESLSLERKGMFLGSLFNKVPFFGYKEAPLPGVSDRYQPIEAP